MIHRKLLLLKLLVAFVNILI